MHTSIRTRLLALALAACAAAAPAAPAFGGGGGGVTLHRDGSKAVPFVAQGGWDPGGPSSHLVLRRDASKAVPLVPDLKPKAPAATDVFDWTDAGIGAGFALVVVGAGALLVSGRRHRAKHTVTPA